MNYKFIALILFCLFASKLSAENTLPDTILVPTGSIITSDNLENLYVITPTNDIIKYNKNGLKMATANYKVLGNITSIDASNPFEIYVFYRDQNKILFLDNLLNIRGECDMESIGVSQIACVARSSDNQIWLFDMADLKLKKYSKDLKLRLESAAFNNFIYEGEISPTMILDINSSILLLNNNKVLEFDLFANYNKVMLSDTMRSFQFLNNQLVYLKKGEILVYLKSSFRSQILKETIPQETLMIRLEKERLFILLNEFVILRPFTE